MKMTAWDLTSPVADRYLAAGAFFSVKMTTLDLTSPVADRYLAAGAFFSVKMTTRDLTSPVAALQLPAGAFFSMKMATQEKFGALNSTGGLGSTSKPFFWRAATWKCQLRWHRDEKSV